MQEGNFKGEPSLSNGYDVRLLRARDAAELNLEVASSSLAGGANVFLSRIPFFKRQISQYLYDARNCASEKCL
jgi:hypothetical protein